MFVLGGGSNILLTKNFEGFVLKNEVSSIEKIAADDDFVYIKCGAGENWHQFVLHCIENSWAGLENLAKKDKPGFYQYTYDDIKRLGNAEV